MQTDQPETYFPEVRPANREGLLYSRSWSRALQALLGSARPTCWRAHHPLSPLSWLAQGRFASWVCKAPGGAQGAPHARPPNQEPPQIRASPAREPFPIPPTPQGRAHLLAACAALAAYRGRRATMCLQQASSRRPLLPSRPALATETSSNQPAGGCPSSKPAQGRILPLACFWKAEFVWSYLLHSRAPYRPGYMPWAGPTCWRPLLP